MLGACERAGVDLVEKDLFSAGKRKILRIFIDKVGGVSVENCASVSRGLSENLDLEENLEVIEGAYTIEVSSPGLDRPLKTTRDFERNLGRAIRIVKSGQKPLKGILKSVNEESITLETSPAKRGHGSKSINGNKPSVEARFLRKDDFIAKVEI